MDSFVFVMKATELVVETMTDDEVLVHYLALQLGTSHESKLGADKINSLLTEQNKTRMHAEMARAFGIIARERLNV